MFNPMPLAYNMGVAYPVLNQTTRLQYHGHMERRIKYHMFVCWFVVTSVAIVETSNLASA